MNVARNNDELTEKIIGLAIEVHRPSYGKVLAVAGFRNGDYLKS